MIEARFEAPQLPGGNTQMPSIKMTADYVSDLPGQSSERLAGATNLATADRGKHAGKSNPPAQYADVLSREGALTREYRRSVNPRTDSGNKPGTDIYRAATRTPGKPCGAQSERITEVDGIAAGKAVEVQAAGEPDRVFLG